MPLILRYAGCRLGNKVTRLRRAFVIASRPALCMFYKCGGSRKFSEFRCDHMYIPSYWGIVLCRELWYVSGNLSTNQKSLAGHRMSTTTNHEKSDKDEVTIADLKKQLDAVKSQCGRLIWQTSYTNICLIIAALFLGREVGRVAIHFIEKMFAS